MMMESWRKTQVMSDNDNHKPQTYSSPVVKQPFRKIHFLLPSVKVKSSFKAFMLLQTQGDVRTALSSGLDLQRLRSRPES